MKAVWYTRQGRPADVIEHGEQPTPRAAANRCVGRSYGMEGPLIIPNSDGSGIVDEVGAGVDAAWLGQRVWLYNGQRGGRVLGTAAEYIALHVDLASALPGDTGF